MTRVSENSSTLALRRVLSQNKRKMEDLQMKGATLKSVNKPSDNPLANIEALALNSTNNDNKQYLSNADNALLNLNTTEKSLEQLTEIVNKAKEIAIAQSSDFYNADVRKSIAKEVAQLKRQALSIANRRVGQRYIFAGYKVNQTPFNNEGKYLGDKGSMNLEVSKDFYIPINLNGAEVFFANGEYKDFDNTNIQKIYNNDNPNNIKPGENLKENELPQDLPATIDRTLASKEGGPTGPNKAIPGQDGFKSEENVFTLLKTLNLALETNNPDIVSGLLESFDKVADRLITLRARVGAAVNSVENAKLQIETEVIDNRARTSELVDADVAELFSDITRQQEILKTTYKSAESSLNTNLLDFLR